MAAGTDVEMAEYTNRSDDGRTNRDEANYAPDGSAAVL